MTVAVRKGLSYKMLKVKTYINKTGGNETVAV